MYHGTEINIGEEIIRNQLIKSSRGDDHWLGDGIYFYSEDVYAFRWIAIKYTNNFRNKYSNDLSGIFDQYMILKATVEAAEERIFSLCDPEIYLFFREFCNQIEEKKEYSDRFKDMKIIDGAMLNILFEDFGYKAKYDLVKAVFPINQRDSSDFTRLNYIPETQVCIKNPEIIKRIDKHSFKEVPERYQSFIARYNKVKFGNNTMGNIRYTSSKNRVSYTNNRNRWKVKK